MSYNERIEEYRPEIPSPIDIEWICKQLKTIAQHIKQAEEIIGRLRLAGEPTHDLELRLREYLSRYERFKRAFPECT